MAVSDRGIVKKSHARLAETLAGLTDDDARGPSLLPGWTVGHVLTHLARNADSHVRLLEAAAGGEVADQYAGGDVQRAADIEAGAGRPAAELVADVMDTAARLERTWDATPEEAWRTGQGRMSSGLWPVAELPFRRWREVELHHVDLGLGYGPSDWPEAYLAEELDRTLASRSADERRRLLAWLVGRAGVPELGPWEG
jgi:maleylpyruvate isomerase